MKTKLGKMFDWKVDDIIDAANPQIAFEKAYNSFSCIIKQTAHFDSFSEKVKMHRLTMVEEAYADRVQITREEAKAKLLNQFFKDTPNYYSVDIEGYERADLQPPPLPVPEDVETTEKMAGYVTPEGLFFGCCLEGHIDLSHDLIRLGLIPQNLDHNAIYTYPDDNGWLKVSDLRRLSFKYDFHNKFQPTLQQEEFVKKAMTKNSTSTFELNGDKGFTKLQR
jgi:hypothetical protein